MKFTCKRKVGQIYINIPGIGAMSVEEHPDKVGNLKPALEAAKKEFLRVYKELTATRGNDGF